MRVAVPVYSNTIVYSDGKHPFVDTKALFDDYLKELAAVARQGDGRVEKGKKDGLRYAPDQARVYINAGQSFGPVPKAVWNVG